MITKKDILEKQFSKKFNGYDPVEVDEFLDEILKAFEALEQNENPTAAGAKAAQGLQRGYASDGKAVELIEQAEKRAQEIMSATNENASMIIASAQDRAQELRNEAKNYEHRIGELKNALRAFMREQMVLFDDKIDEAYRSAEKKGEYKAVSAPKPAPVSEYERAMTSSDEFLRSLRQEERVPHLAELLNEEGGEQ